MIVLINKAIQAAPLLSAYTEDQGLWPWLNAKEITSADSAEAHGVTTGFARGAPCIAFT
jgi:hypothetical protein